MEPSSRDPLVRRRTVITLGSAGHRPEPDSTSEVREAPNGRITITVKNLPLKLVEDEIPTRDDPCWVTIRHVDSPAPPLFNASSDTLPSLVYPSEVREFIPKTPEPTVPLHKSVSACELKPVFKMKLGDESKILRLAQQDEFRKHLITQAPVIEPEKLHSPPVPLIESKIIKTDNRNDNEKISSAKNNRLETELAAKLTDRVSSVPYTEWLKTDDLPDEKPRVSFDHKYQGEVKPVIADEAPLKIEVIETEKSNTPKSILKNVRRNSDAGFSKSSRPDEPDKLLAWKMEYHQREAMVGSRLRALVARADEYFINHQNSKRVFPASPFHLPDIEPLKLPLSSEEESCDSSNSSSTESFPELKFNTSTSSEEYGKIKLPNPTPEVTKDTNNSSESIEDTEMDVAIEPVLGRRNSAASSVDLSVRRHSHPLPNPNHAFKPIQSSQSSFHSIEDERPTPRRIADESTSLKPAMPIEKATEIVRQFFQSEPGRSRGSSPAIQQHKKWSVSESSLLADEPSTCSSDISAPTSASSSFVFHGSHNERGRPQMRSRIPVRINRPTSTSCLAYNRSFPLCQNNAQQTRASSVGSRRIWSSASSSSASKDRNSH